MLNSNIPGAVARRSILSVLLCASALLVVCGSAFASTASLGSSQILYYTAATTGETNTVTVSISGSDFVLTDSTATITSETGSCVIGGGGHTLTCPAVNVNAQTVRLYDQNDSYTNNTSTVGGNIYGGTGGDTLNGGYGSASGESLRGEDGNDVIRRPRRLRQRHRRQRRRPGHRSPRRLEPLRRNGQQHAQLRKSRQPLFASFLLNAVEEAESYRHTTRSMASATSSAAARGTRSSRTTASPGTSSAAMAATTCYMDSFDTLDGLRVVLQRVASRGADRAIQRTCSTATGRANARPAPSAR